MGALILLEKSQRIINSIVVSPVTPEEYILGKVFSIGLISEIVGLVLMLQGSTENYVLCAIGIFAGSMIFSLCGIIVGTKIESLNQYIVWTIPFEIVGFVPVIPYRIGILWNERMMLLHPGCSIMQLIERNMEMAFLSIMSIVIWLIILFGIARLIVMVMSTMLSGIVTALLVVAISSNKVEGMAVGKLSGLFGIFLFVPYAVTGTIKYVFCLFPMFWIGEWSISGGVGKLMIAFIEFIVWISILFFQFQKKME